MTGDESPTEAVLADDAVWLNSSPQRMVRERRKHWGFLLAAAGIVIATWLLRVRDDQRVEIWPGSGVLIPESCGSRIWFGIDCPGCGLTRCFIHCGHADWRSAWQVNRAGVFVVLFVVAQFPYRITRLIELGRLGTSGESAWWNYYIPYTLCVLLLANWLLKVSGIW